jgi:hypothetical protein
MRMIALVLVVALAGPIDLLELARMPVGRGLPSDWKLRPVKSRQPPEFEVVDGPEGRLLRVSGHSQAAWAYRELSAPVAPGPGILRWTWRVLKRPEGADLRDRRADDSALRVFVIFGTSDGWSRRSHAIFYSWGNREPDGLTLPSHVSDRLHVVRVAGDAQLGPAWRRDAVDPFADYRRIWHRAPEPITAIGVMQDTDMTHMAAVGELRDLVWDPR